MFITRDEFTSSVSGLLLEEGVIGWAATELPQQQAWFLVHFGKVDADRDSEFTWTNTILLFDFLSVEHFIQTNQDSNLRLISVHIVTPAHVNGRGTWQMDQLRAVWQGTESLEEQTTPTNIFETVTGEKYCHSLAGAYKMDLSADTLKFVFSH